jgi:hypothetical protein
MGVERGTHRNLFFPPTKEWEVVMGYALYSSEPTSTGKWSAVILDDCGNCRLKLPCKCETEAEARRYAEAYLRFYS